MSFLRVILRSLSHHWRSNLALALGIAAATAVITGALLVGDSVRGSLRRLTIERLGRIDEVVLSERFFRTELAVELQSNAEFQEHFSEAVPAILLQGTLQQNGNGGTSGGPARASGVTVLGCDQRLWTLGQGRPEVMPGRNEIVLNAPLARELGVGVGAEILLRLPRSNQVPADSPLGRKLDTIRSIGGLKVVSVVPATGLGRFGLRPSQQLPLNAFLDLATLQSALQQPTKANALLIAGTTADDAPSLTASASLVDAFQPSLADYGLTVQRARLLFNEPGADAATTVYDYWTLTSDRMMFAAATDSAAENALATAHAQPVLTYLANSISKDGTEIPYSTITAVDSVLPLGPIVDVAGIAIETLADDEIVLNSWAAADLGAQPGDHVSVSFFEPESTHGITRERTESFRVKAVVPLIDPTEPYDGAIPPRYEQLPTLANDRHLTPAVEGLTDRDSIDDWDAPFPFDHGRVRGQDEVYWDNHRTTPKAFVSLAAGRNLWGTRRFGQTTSWRVPATANIDGETVAEMLSAQLKRDRAHPGFQFLSVKRQGLAAARGTTPFELLFLGFSFFLIASAVMLVALLFRLGLEQRSPEVGLLLAVGLRQRQIAGMLTLEGAVVAELGAALGVAAGVGYAWIMLAGLRSWWLAAVVTPFLQLHVSWISLIVGYLVGYIVAVATILWSLRQLRRHSIRGLLAGQAAVTDQVTARTSRRSIIVRIVLFAFAVGLTILATQLGGEAQAGAFFGSGACILTAGILSTRSWLQPRPTRGTRSAPSLSLARLALSNAGRNPGRSTLTVGLVAAASFLIVAISAFRIAPTLEGAGGFDTLAESDRPIFHDLNTSDGRDELGIPEDDTRSLSHSEILSLRVQSGDDASCLNLFQAEQPRVLGVPQQMIEYFDDTDRTGFGWAAMTADQRHNPWLLLQDDQDDTIPVFLDKNTALYSLHLYGGIGEVFTIDDERGNETRLRVAGLLSNSIFQGSLLVGEPQFLELFPGVKGYQYFLVRSPEGTAEEVRGILEGRLSDQGLDTVDTARRLTSLLAVQNTYLATFQSLGALGLLLGTLGLGTVQLRNVFERRRELAVLRATGFRRGRLAQLVVWENTLLLLIGLAVGVFSAALTVLPHWLSGGAAVPVGSLMWMLGTVLVVGVAAGLLPLRATMRAPLVAALRGE